MAITLQPFVRFTCFNFWLTARLISSTSSNTSTRRHWPLVTVEMPPPTLFDNPGHKCEMKWRGGGVKGKLNCRVQGLCEKIKWLQTPLILMSIEIRIMGPVDSAKKWNTGDVEGLAKIEIRRVYGESENNSSSPPYTCEWHSPHYMDLLLSARIAHVAEVHKTSGDQWYCKDCGVTYETKYKLLKHLNAEHSRSVGSQKLACSVCNKLFVTKKGLDLHQATHNCKFTKGRSRIVYIFLLWDVIS